MIDLSSLKAPGWQRVVTELAAPASDDHAFLVRMTSVLAQVASARRAVFFSIPGQRETEQQTPDAKAEFWWPGAGGEGTVTRAGAESTPPTEGLNDAKAAALAAAAARQPRVFGLDNDATFYGDSGKGFLLAVPVAAGLPGEAPTLPLRGVIALELEHRSRQALQTTLALVEVLAGYAYSYTAMQALHRTRAASASLDLAGRLLAGLNTTPSFKGAAMRLVNDLSRQLALDRVALGWVHGPGASDPDPGARRECRLAALSDTENVDRRMSMVRKLEGAMDECMDQRQAVLFPPPPPGDEGDADAVLSRAVTHAHRDLASTDARVKVASIPLRAGDERGERVVGVLTIESGSPTGGVDIAVVELLQATLDLLSPVLLVRRSDDRSLPARARDSAVRTGAWLVGPTHTTWKLAGAALLVLSLVVTFVKTDYRVGAPMEVRPREIRTVSIPFDAVLWSLAPGVEPGKTVEAGQLLGELDTTTMRLGMLDSQAEVLRYEKESDEAMKQGEVGQAQQAAAKAEQASAKVARLRHEIERSKLVSPIAGTIISADVREKVRSQVKLGDAIFQVADLSDLVAVAKVEDRDISLVRLGQAGDIAAKSDPAHTVPVEVEEIVPLAQPKDGVNSFEVRARLKPAAPQEIEGFRPGVEGQARFNAERMSLIRIASRRIVDQLRLWLWW